MNSGILPFQSVEDVAQAIGFKTTPLAALLDNPAQFYGSFLKEKADGKKREINPPKPPLNEFQSSLKFHLRDRVQWLSCVHGGVQRKSIVTNARPHLNKRMIAKFDIASFFPSVNSAMVGSVFERLGCSKSTAQALGQLTTLNDRLPQGSPTSTLLGNLVLEPLDRELLRIARPNKLAYTRYVDDITLSGDDDLRSFQGAVCRLIKAHDFKIADNKMDFVEKHRPQVVTGLLVNNKLRPTTQFIRELKLTIRRCWMTGEGLNAVAEEEGEHPATFLRMIRGKIQHVRSVDPKLGREIRGLLVRIWEQ